MSVSKRMDGWIGQERILGLGVRGEDGDMMIDVREEGGRGGVSEGAPPSVSGGDDDGERNYYNNQ